MSVQNDIAGLCNKFSISKKYVAKFNIHTYKMNPAQLRIVDLRTTIVLARSFLREPTFRELYNMRKFQRSKNYNREFFKITNKVSWFDYGTHKVSIHHMYEFSLWC